jgi:uncharacterized membrane protein YhhN
MNNLLLYSMGMAVINWIAVVTENRRLEYFAKPATLLLLIIWFATSLPSIPPVMGTLFLLGLSLSLSGDIFLMFPDRHFLKGLIAFLLAHLTYIYVFNMNGLIITPTSIFIALAIAVLAFLILRRILDSLREKGDTAMAIPVTIYAIVLSVTLWSTTSTLARTDWPAAAGLLTALGGAAFFISDAAIAWNRFVGPHPGGRIFEMVTYHLAQFTLSAGVLIFLGVFQ